MTRMSREVKLSILGGGMLCASACVCGGCLGGWGRPRVAETRSVPVAYSTASPGKPEPQWYDAKGNKIPERWTAGPAGELAPAVPAFDRWGRPLEFDADGNVTGPPPEQTATAAATTYRSTSGGYTSSSSYYRRSVGLPFFWSFGPSYSSGYTRVTSPARPAGSTYFGGSRPGGSFGSGGSSRPSGGSSSGGSVSRGGFGGTGASAAAGS